MKTKKFLAILHDGSVAAVVGEGRELRNRRPKTKRQARQDYRRWSETHPPEERRQRRYVLICSRCQTSKHTDGSDGLGGFSPNDSRTNGWSWLCKWCMRDRNRS